MSAKLLPPALGLALLLLSSPSTGVRAAPVVATSSEPTLSYGFSECVDNTRTLFYYSENEATCANSSDASQVVAKPPVHGLRCDLTCERGYFLGANFSGNTPVSGCEKCEKGQYSLGGGKLYSKRTNAWTTPLPIDIHTDCVTRNMYTGKWQSNCAPWNATADGAMISSGDNSQIMERYEAARLFSTLRISATFVRPGSITYQFRVDAEAPYDGLVFEVDETAVTPLVSKTEGWNEATFEVAAGSHTFSWDYTKDYSGDEGEDKAFIKVIEIVGTSYADTFCHPCGGDMTMSGGSICKFCKANEYADSKSHSELDFTCYKCPDGTFAPKGSIGLDSCVEKRACASEDLVETFTPCVDGKRNATFSWSEPQTCDTKLHGSIALPEAQADLPCDTCERGYVLTDDDKCERCPAGQKLGDDDDDCAQCPAGQVAVNAIEFGLGTRDGWSKWPSVVDSVTAKKAGWKLTRHGLSFAAHTKEEGEWSRPSRFPLPFNVTFAYSGYINVTYQLSHVPTFESDGVRAWLELEIKDRDASVAVKDGADKDTGSDDNDDDDNDDDDELADVGGNIAHLSHGGENGTFNQVIHFNVTTRTTKQFTLVLRTTSPAAERLIHAKLQYMGFLGTEDGGSVACGSCPAGYEAISGDDDDDKSTNDPGCRICPAGTFAKVTNGVSSCTKCPANTFSSAGADACESCGRNTFSVAGSKLCAAPAILTVNATSSSGTAAGSSSSASVSSSVSTTNGSLPSYDLSLLESLIWGNESFLFGDSNAAITSSKDLLSVASVVPSGGIKVDESHIVFVGLFRPVDKSWKEQVLGQIVEELVDAARDRPYVIDLTMLNPRDAGNFFTQKTGRYGEVECAAPAQWKVSSGGDRMEIVPLQDGGGVQVNYRGGSKCRSGKVLTTQINFVCDLRAGTTVAPTSSSRDDDSCKTTITWKTAFACPICEASYFSELRTACSSGQQSVTYNSVKSCYGGDKPSSVPVVTCNEVVLDTKAMYTVYAVISVVGFIVLILMAAIFVTHRKYLTAYNEYMYLKGKMPTSVATKEDGSKETTFEFSNNSNSHSDSPAAPTKHTGFNAEEKEEEREDDNGIELNVRSV